MALPNKPNPRISVVICTRNRAVKLKQALEQWGHIQTKQLAELVLVDNGSTDKTAETISNFSKSSPIPLTYVRCGTPGLARARNEGIACAKGEIIVFTDDDCYPYADFLDQIACLFDSRPAVSIIGGRVLLYDPTDLRTSIKESESEEILPEYSLVKAGHMHGANLSMRRDVLEKAGLFDERLGAGTPLSSAEDTDLIARASWQGFVGLYHPGPTVLHHHERKGAETLARMRRGYAIGRGGYIFKFILNPETRRLYLRFWLSKARGDPTRERLHEMLGAWRMFVAMVRHRPH